MKVAITYPPLNSQKVFPLLTQNRQFQWTHTLWTAYPMVPAYAATLLKKAGHQVTWLDGINQGWSYKKWLSKLNQASPDLIMIETKTPVIKKHWQIINQLKAKNKKMLIVLVGDHVTALPQESLQNSKVDYILTGGDYDFLLLNLANHLSRGEKLEPGIYYRSRKRVVKNTGPFKLNHNLNKLPFVDRKLTQWKLYAYKNSNYLQLPGTYTMFGRDCWWGQCSFCSWTTLYPGQCYRQMSVQRALDEIDHILKHYPVKEIMDDSGTFPHGQWLRQFCQGMIKKGYHKKVKLNCNLRFNAHLNQKDYQLMAQAGFRFILYGLESVNQKTLDKLNKNLQVAQIEQNLTWAKKAGLYPHVTVMIGYPWETKKDIEKTLEFAKNIFKKSLADSLQATMIVPYPGTPLFKLALKKKWLKTWDWNKYDMSRPVLKTSLTKKETKNLIQAFYQAIFSPQFIFRKIKEGLTSWQVFKYYLRLSLGFFSKHLDYRS